ncbi:MAG: hypothetical protein CVV23_00085 [Ignavibacteriae bacterium HGW-Ignavibacteriae-2]|jgi:predicted membrane protein|nr:cell wall-active antibiotics response protein [Bacteroidota bacterium]PKL90288.1 MAG: hypothetical protein CVV23_00085 [Ignavibacteriae bacterium HGW-Ignavibacteriae-2]
MNKAQSNTRLIIGLIIIAIGVIFLLGNLDILDYDIPRIIFRWQSILIIIGLVIFGTTTNKSTGAVLIAIGLIGHFPEFWPLLLIIIGLYIIIRTGGLSKSKESPELNETGPAASSEFLNDVSIFGGGKKYIQTDNFRGGKITSIFGGSEIDLFDCKLSEGYHTMDVFALFGGSTIIVPSDWKVEIDVVPIFGGFVDNRRKDPNLIQRDDRILYVKGLILFGGGEIKN